MTRLLTAIIAIPIAFVLYSSVADTQPITDVQQSISSLTTQRQDSANPFALGSDRTVDDAFNSCSFSYGDCSRF